MICVTLPASTGGSLTNLEKTWKPGAQTLMFRATAPVSASVSRSTFSRTVSARRFRRPFRSQRFQLEILQT